MQGAASITAGRDQPFQRGPPLLAWHFHLHEQLAIFETLALWKHLVTVALCNFRLSLYSSPVPCRGLSSAEASPIDVFLTKSAFRSHRCSCIVASASSSASSCPLSLRPASKRSYKRVSSVPKVLDLSSFPSLPSSSSVPVSQHMPSLREQTMGCLNRLVSKMRRSWRRRSRPLPPRPLHIVSLSRELNNEQSPLTGSEKEQPDGLLQDQFVFGSACY